MGEARAKQLADRIQVLVAELLERRVKDPRLGFVTVTDARLTGDLREASVFYTVFGDEPERAATAAALASARGLIRSEVGKALGLRHSPSVDFYLDAVPETAGRDRGPAGEGEEGRRRGGQGRRRRETRRGRRPLQAPDRRDGR